MRDTYVLILFVIFIIAGTFLAATGKTEPQHIMIPLVTGFLGLLASTKPIKTRFHHEEWGPPYPKPQQKVKDITGPHRPISRAELEAHEDDE